MKMTLMMKSKHGGQKGQRSDPSAVVRNSETIYSLRTLLLQNQIAFQ
jgi:hypothetical protein